MSKKEATKIFTSEDKSTKPKPKEQKQNTPIEMLMTSVKELPNIGRLNGNSDYDNIIRKALASNEIFKINLPMKRAYAPLAQRIKKNNAISTNKQLKLFVRNKTLYIAENIEI
jgi:23S rRNA C2498 (ribose-2'-O)-methylase RlmM